MHFGDWEGQSIQQLYEQFPETLADFWQKPTQTTLPNAESMQQFHFRVTTAMSAIQQRMEYNGWQSALVVTIWRGNQTVKVYGLTATLG